MPSDSRDPAYADILRQAFVVFMPVKSVGVMGDGRCYDYVVALSAVLLAPAGFGAYNMYHAYRTS